MDNDLSEKKLGIKLNKDSLDLLRLRRSERKKEWVKVKQIESWDDVLRDPVSIILFFPFLPFLYFERKISRNYIKRSEAEWDRKIDVNQCNASDPDEKASFKNKIDKLDQDLKKSRDEVRSSQIYSTALIFSIIGFLSTVWIVITNFSPLMLAITGLATVGSGIVGASIGMGIGFVRNKEIDVFAHENGEQSAGMIIDELINQQHIKNNESYQILETKRKILKSAKKLGIEEITDDIIDKYPKSDIYYHLKKLSILTNREIKDLSIDLNKKYSERIDTLTLT